MTQRTFVAVAGLIFLLVALLHALRLVLGWTAIINGWTVPPWVSWAAVVICSLLAFTAFRLKPSAS